MDHLHIKRAAIAAQTFKTKDVKDESLEWRNLANIEGVVDISQISTFDLKDEKLTHERIECVYIFRTLLMLQNCAVDLLFHLMDILG